MNKQGHTADVIKASGEREEFHKNKFCDSLKKAGAPDTMVEEICEKVSLEMGPEVTTSELFRKASRYLAKQHPKAGARYSLKNGIAELGPAGFIFEQFVEVTLQALGYETKRNQIIQGECVTHEIDVYAEKGHIHYFIEAKYHNKKGIKTPLDVVMYADARLHDIKNRHEKMETEDNEHRMWLFTNTKFTGKAKKYAECKNITLTGWNYPKENGLEDLIAHFALYPVTILPSVGKYELEQFAKNDMMLARDLAPYKAEDLVEKFGLQKEPAENIINEAHTLVYGEND